MRDIIMSCDLDRHSVWDKVYSWAVCIYMLHMAVMANLTYCFPDVLGWLRIPSFVFVTGLLIVAIVYRVLTRPFPRNAVVFLSAFILAILSGALYSTANISHIWNILIKGSFAKYVLLFAVAFLYEENPDKRFRQLVVIGVLSMCVYWLIVHLGLINDDSFHYMTIGYGCMPWWIMILQGIFYFPKKYEKLLCLVVTVYFAAFILFYGNRGAMVLLILIVLLSIFVWLPFRKSLKVGLVLLVAAILLVVNITSVLKSFGIIFGFKKDVSRILEVTSKRDNLFYDSGRLPKWTAGLESIIQHPFFGTGVGSDRVILGTYVHNVVIELAMDFGIVIAVAVYVWLLSVGWHMIFLCKDRSWKALFIPFYTFSMFQLLLSSTIWESGYLVASIIIYFAYKNQRERIKVCENESKSAPKNNR